MTLAGVGSHGASQDVTEEECRLVIVCDLTSVFLCCKAALSVMRAQRYRRIIITGWSWMN